MVFTGQLVSGWCSDDICMHFYISVIHKCSFQCLAMIQCVGKRNNGVHWEHKNKSNVVVQVHAEVYFLCHLAHLAFWLLRK